MPLKIVLLRPQSWSRLKPFFLKHFFAAVKEFERFRSQCVLHGLCAPLTIIKNEKSAQLGSFGGGHPADIRGSFVRTSRPKRRGRPRQGDDPKGFAKVSVRKTLGWIFVPLTIKSDFRKLAFLLCLRCLARVREFRSGPNTVSESTVSNTKLSEFFGPHRVPKSELSELLSAYYLRDKVNSPSSSQNSLSWP